MGAWVLGPAPASMRIVGTVAEWETWTGMVFPESGDYIVPEALDLVAIDVEQDRGEYLETNLWMEHLLYFSSIRRGHLAGSLRSLEQRGPEERRRAMRPNSGAV